MSNYNQEFKFKKHEKIGYVDAQEDISFLEECFVDTGELDILADTMKPECIVLGRTGSGKTALLEMLARKKGKSKSIRIAPDQLGLTYLSNNQMLKFFMEIGTEMDMFFRVLWRHILIVEVIKLHFELTNEAKLKNLMAQLKAKTFKKKSFEAARDYLIKHGETFWKDTEERVTEFTKSVEDELTRAASIQLDAAIPGLGSGKVEFSPNLVKKMTSEQKGEIVNRGRSVVNVEQIRDLNNVVDLLKEEFLDDQQKHYYIILDRLDEKWVHDDFRYQLIRALFETIRDLNPRFRPVVKVTVAIRHDLLHRVFRETRHITQDQIEKYRSLYLELKWGASDLEQILDLRVNQLIQRQYTKAKVKTREVLRGKVNQQNPIEYIIERTLHTPRDVILFFNECISEAQGKAAIGHSAIKIAEGRYSSQRLEALADEWSVDYPNLVSLSDLIKGRNQIFSIGDLITRIEDFSIRFITNSSNKPSDPIYKLIEEHDSQEAYDELVKHLVKILFRVGIVGIRLESNQETRWTHLGHRVDEAEIAMDDKCYVHPAFWRVLSIQGTN